MTAWKLPLIAAALVLPIVAGFLVGGPGIGVAMGALVALVVVVIAVRQRPRGPIGETPALEARRHVLLVVTREVEEPGSVRAILREAGLEGSAAEGARVLVLSPASIGFLDRWATDVADARRRAQERLVTTVAALARAGVDAEARVGDEDVVQAVEDQLGNCAADAVVLVSDGAEGAEREAEAARELGSRLRADFRHVVLGG